MKRKKKKNLKKKQCPLVDGDKDRDEPITKAQRIKEEGGDKKDKDLSKVPPQLRKQQSSLKRP